MIACIQDNVSIADVIQIDSRYGMVMDEEAGNTSARINEKTLKKPPISL